jgi:hypothetical protein
MRARDPTIKEGDEMTDIERLRREVAYSAKVDLENLLLKRKVEILLAALEQLDEALDFDDPIPENEPIIPTDQAAFNEAMRNAREVIKYAKGAD